MYTCVLGYVGTYVRVYVCTCVCVYMRTCVRAYVRTCVRAYVRTCVRAYVRTCVRAYVRTCVGVYVCTCVRDSQVNESRVDVSARDFWNITEVYCDRNIQIVLCGVSEGYILVKITVLTDSYKFGKDNIIIIIRRHLFSASQIAFMFS